MTEKSRTKDRIKEITGQLEQGIRDLFTSGKYLEYLQTMSRFHRYSTNNTLLIHMQRPDATRVAGFHKWQDEFGRNVKRGEKGIKIIAPTPFKKRIEQEKLDPETKAPLLGKDGKVVMEEVEIKIPLYRVVTVFDVSQTEGKPLPQLAENLSGDVRDYGVFMEAVRQASPVPIIFEVMKPDMDGYFNQEKKLVALREGMSEVQTVSGAIHEVTHAKLHDYSLRQADAGKKDAEPPKPQNRSTEEVEAESVSYAVCQYYGIQTAANSFGYIASWSKDKDLPELRASLETINKTASGLIEDIDKNLAALQKERGKTQTAAVEPEQPAVSAEPEQAVPSEKVESSPAPAEEAAPVSARRENTVEPAPSELADYPMPDPSVSIAARDAYGYTKNDMLPLSKERAVELLERDMTVYMLQKDNCAEMAFDKADIDAHSGLFGIAREEWEQTRGYQAKLQGNGIDAGQHTVAELEAQARAGEPISLLELSQAIHRERPSVRAQLKAAPRTESHKAERKPAEERGL